MFQAGGFVLTPEEVTKRKSYFAITALDEQRLREAHVMLQGHAGEIIDRFYEHLLSHEHTRSMLAAPGLLDRLKGMQRKYFEELTAGTYDIAYFENRLRVGQAHDRVGLSPEWYLGAYNHYLGVAVEILSRELSSKVPQLVLVLQSLTKIIHLDMALALDAYIFSAQERLQSKNAALVATQSAKQQLTDMIVHDLQNPLAGLTAFLQVLKSDPSRLEPTVRDALDEALHRCGDLSQMIFNVLHISRAEAGRLETYVEEVDLALVARDTVAAFRIVAERDGRVLKLDAGEAVKIRTDQTLVRRMMGNLVRNALRHTPRGTTVIVRAERNRLSVVDDGPGIPAELHGILFERFGAPALRDKGLRVDSGLGLAFCKAAADAVGARITVTSDGKKGTAFRIEWM